MVSTVPISEVAVAVTIVWQEPDASPVTSTVTVTTILSPSPRENGRESALVKDENPVQSSVQSELSDWTVVISTIMFSWSLGDPVHPSKLLETMISYSSETPNEAVPLFEVDEEGESTA